MCSIVQRAVLEIVFFVHKLPVEYDFIFRYNKS